MDDEAKLRERVQFIHDSIATDAIIERFVEGRELYCGVIGNQRLQVLPVWEMTFSKMPEGQHRIATERVKWNVKYQDKMGVDTGPAKDLPESAYERVRAAHHAPRLQGSGAQRLRPRRPAARRPMAACTSSKPTRIRKLRGKRTLPNRPPLDGLPYPALLQRILTTGLRWEPERLG